MRGIVVMVVFALLGFQLLRLYNGVPTANYRHVYVSAPLIGNLLSHDAVRVAGKRVGQVLKIDVGSDGRPRVELQLEPGAKLPAGTKVQVRANGLLGARYVELVPGRGGGRLADGATIRGTDASYTYGLPEAIDVFDSGTRKGLQKTVGGLGAGVLANGPGLNTAVKIARVRVPQFDGIMRSVLAREGSAQRLLPAGAAAFAHLADNTSSVRPWTRAVGDAMVPFIHERQGTRDTLDAASPALSAADSGLRRGTKLLAAVRHLSAAAAVTLPPAPAGTRSLATLLRIGGPVLKRSYVLAGQARAGVNAPWDIVPGLDRLRPRLAELVKNARPLLQELGDHSCDFKNGAATLRAMTGYEQNSAGGELGQAMAFRLQAFLPGTAALGFGGPGSLIKRASYPADCVYDSKPYPQFGGTGAGVKGGRP
jgi:phospholipid/cholesterol/gamma-HCH transport system substrate-binding protein